MMASVPLGWNEWILMFRVHWYEAATMEGYNVSWLFLYAANELVGRYVYEWGRGSGVCVNVYLSGGVRVIYIRACLFFFWSSTYKIFLEIKIMNVSWFSFLLFYFLKVYFRVCLIWLLNILFLPFHFNCWMLFLSRVMFIISSNFIEIT